MKSKVQQNRLEQRCCMCKKMVLSYCGLYARTEGPGNKYEAWHAGECDEKRFLALKNDAVSSYRHLSSMI